MEAGVVLVVVQECPVVAGVIVILVAAQKAAPVVAVAAVEVRVLE